MIDLGISKLALIAVVALVVVGPERLPKVARMAGTLMGRAQRYMSEVKNEVNRQVELDELKKMQEAAKSAVTEVQSSFQAAQTNLEQVGQQAAFSLTESYDDFADNGGYVPRQVTTSIRQGKDSWGVKKAAMPQWYKRSAGVKTRIQSGAARVKRHRRAASILRPTKSFF